MPASDEEVGLPDVRGAAAQVAGTKPGVLGPEPEKEDDGEEQRPLTPHQRAMRKRSKRQLSRQRKKEEEAAAVARAVELGEDPDDAAAAASAAHCAEQPQTAPR